MQRQPYAGAGNQHQKQQKHRKRKQNNRRRLLSAIFLLQKTNLRKNLGTTKLRKVHHAKLKYVHITNINYITNRHQLLV